jgi:transcriptional regulator with XRE-family HTH domain
MLGQTIKTLREAKGLSRQALAKRLKLDRTAVAKWESGQHFPREGHQIALATALGVSVRDLLGRGASGTRANATLVDTMSELPTKLVALLAQTTHSLKALRIAAPYPTSAHVQQEFRRKVSERVLAGTLQVQRIEIVYSVDRLKEILWNIVRYDGRNYWVKSYCAGVKEVVPGMGGYFFDDTHFILGAYWSGIPPHNRPGLVLSGEPFFTYFKGYWDEIWQRGTLLNHRGARDLSRVKELAGQLGVAAGDWQRFVDESRALDVGDDAPPLI